MDNKYEKAAFNITSTKEFCQSLQNVLQMIGINCSFKQAHNCKNNTFTLVVSGNRQIQILLDWLYKNAIIFLQRKYLKYKELIKINEFKKS